MSECIYDLKVNGKSVGQVKAPKGTARQAFIDHIKRSINPDFNPSRDTLEIVNTTPPPNGRDIRHPARERSSHNRYVDAILTRHVNNLIATYGEARVFKLLADGYGLTVKTDKAG